jgi:hypothetical protein
MKSGAGEIAAGPRLFYALYIKKVKAAIRELTVKSHSENERASQSHTEINTRGRMAPNTLLTIQHSKSPTAWKKE